MMDPFEGSAVKKVADNIREADRKRLTEAGVVRVGFEIPIRKGKPPYKGRLYEMDGRKGCSVSTACAAVAPLYLQEYWKAGDQAKMEEHREKTAGQGTEGHKLIELDAKETVTPAEELREWFGEWKKTQAQFKIEEEYSEVMVFSKVFAFGGQIDRVGMFDGKRCVIDFKTGRYNHMNLWKTEAYRQAYIEMTGDVEVGAVVLHLPRPDLMKRGHKVRHYTIERHTSCFLAFLSAYQVFKMLYYKPLLEAGMSEEDVFSHLPFMLYQREFGA